VRKTTDLNIYR